MTEHVHVEMVTRTWLICPVCGAITLEPLNPVGYRIPCSRKGCTTEFFKTDSTKMEVPPT